MSLSTYKDKRNFRNTPEPAGGSAKPRPEAARPEVARPEVARNDGGVLHFVVQEHAATSLHYDFRLEMDGVLKSWAIPKGPSLNPADKRLAMQVEDHPYDYKDFEGTIPAGNYGAGTVIVWDRGTYEPLAPLSSKVLEEKELLKELKAGSLKFRLNGSKLKGEFALVHMAARGKQENAWLLIKHKDQFATTEDVLLKDKSVISRKTLRGMAKAPSATWKSGRKDAGAKDADAVPGAAELAKIGHKAPMPKDVAPMLATLVDKPFDDPGWIYEIKWDGYRAISYIQKGKVVIRSRNNKDFEKKYYPIRDALETWKVKAVIDGEIAVVDEKGLSAFNKLQNWRSEVDGDLNYYVFDLLWLEGYSLLDAPLTERKALLQRILPPMDNIHYSEGIAAKGNEFFKAAEKNGLEGMIAKEADSPYRPGDRSRSWLKVKTVHRQEVVIGGYTRNKDTPKAFSALLVGVYDTTGLVYTGKIGTGWDEATQKGLMARFKPLVTKTIPFTRTPDVNAPSRFRPDPPGAVVTWLKPSLVCEVAYRELTEDGIMRHPSYQGLREDKAAKDVVLEVAQPRAKGTKTKRMERKTLLNPNDASQTKTVGGHELTFSHLSKIYWPKEKYTKRDMLNYYYQMAPYILPYLKDRPMSLNRFPEGITGQGFYQKDVTGKAPDWATLYAYHSEGEAQEKHFLVAMDEASLLYMAGLGCIEMNPWSSRVERPDNPDWCLLDLDPSKNNFDQVIETARVIHDLLESIKVPGYCKTSGFTGLHVYIPLAAQYTYEQSKEFAHIIVQIVQRQLPKITSLERTVSKRGTKIYLDFLQNRPQATLASAYSVRPKPGATVSMPLDWEEVKKGIKMSDFTILNALDRVKERGDLFKPVLGKGIDMSTAIKKLQAL